MLFRSTLGGSPLSGIGFGLGIDRVLLAMQAEEVLPKDRGYLDLFIIGLGDAGRARGFQLLDEVRRAGFVADFAFGERALKGAMKGADRLGAKYVLVMGEDEVNSGAGQIKELSSGKVHSVTLSSLVTTLVSLASVEAK